MNNFTICLYIKLNNQVIYHLYQIFSHFNPGILKGPWDPQGGNKGFTKGPCEESSFWTSIYLWNKIDKIKDGFKVILFVFT